MNCIAQFEKISYLQFYKDWTEILGNFISEEFVERIYNNIKLPKRTTKDFAVYDFYSPLDINLSPKETLIIPTGIRCKMNEGWILQLYPKSRLGYKYQFQLDNTMNIIDRDYYFSKNEGHILVKITNNSNNSKIIIIHMRQKMLEGIFLSYGITINDNENKKRNTDFDSTTYIK